MKCIRLVILSSCFKIKCIWYTQRCLTVRRNTNLSAGQMPDICINRPVIIGLTALKAVAYTRIKRLTNRQYRDGPFFVGRPSPF